LDAAASSQGLVHAPTTLLHIWPVAGSQVACGTVPVPSELQRTTSLPWQEKALGRQTAQPISAAHT
jgi:hypothetical protein